MKVKELIQELLKFPEDLDVYYGYDEGLFEDDPLPGKTLYTFDVNFYEKLKVYGNCSPRKPTIEENVIVLEFD